MKPLGYAEVESTAAHSILRRLRAGAIHLVASAVVAALAGGLVFLLWYPGAYRLMAGGTSLFALVVMVDVTLGPLLTIVVFSNGKPRRELVRDLAVVGFLQMAALAYGLNSVYEARPVVTVFEVDRLRVLNANQIALDELNQALPALRRLSKTGPWLLAARLPKSVDEANVALFGAAYGVDVGQRPGFWEPYADHAARALARSMPLQRFIDRNPKREAEIVAFVAKIGLDVHRVRFLPVVARGDWIALIGADGAVVDFFPGDGF